VAEISLTGLDETGVWKFLAARTGHEHVVAPAPVLQRVLALADKGSFTYSDKIPTECLPGANIFVWDLDHSELERARGLHPGCRVYGILRDVWCTALAGGDVFAMEAYSSDPVICYAILCPPRSGSNFLCWLLAEAGLGMPREHIRDFFVELCRHGYAFDDLMGRMTRLGTRGGYFGTKLISHYLQDLHGLTEARTNLKAICRFLTTGNFRIIRLLRDPAEEAVSAYFAHQTGVWHLHRRDATAGHSAVPYDGGVLMEVYGAMYEQNELVREISGQLSPVLCIEYRELDADPRSVVARIAEFLGAPAGAAQRIDLMRGPQKISSTHYRMQEYLCRLNRELGEAAIAMKPAESP
jgi:LPS sulfotransferase NodH